MSIIISQSLLIKPKTKRKQNLHEKHPGLFHTYTFYTHDRQICHYYWSHRFILRWITYGATSAKKSENYKVKILLPGVLLCDSRNQFYAMSKRNHESAHNFLTKAKIIIKTNYAQVDLEFLISFVPLCRF